MKLATIYFTLGAVCSFCAMSQAMAQDKIYRCPGNEYTNNSTTAIARGCKVIEGSNVTVVTTVRANRSGAGNDARAAGSAAPASSRIESQEQRGRDSDAREILDSELKKLESKQADLRKEFNNGEPEKRGDEARNHQRYLDRVAELKAQIDRNDNDIAGIKREISRLQPTNASR